MWTTLLLFVLAATERPAVPATLDTTHPTCLALGAPDADALYLVPRSICDSRMCKLRLELQAVRADGATPEPEVLGEGELTAGAALWSSAVRARIEAEASRFAFPCRSTPVTQPLLAGAQRYALAERQGTWWARSDNGREQPLSRLGEGTGAPEVVDGHPGFGAWAFARTHEIDGRLVLLKIPLRRLAAPPLDALVAAPGEASDDRFCVGFDRDAPAALLATRRTICAGDRCRHERWLVRVDPRGASDLARLDGSPDAARAHLSGLDVGCTDDGLDEPTFGDASLMVGSSMSGSSIELGVFVPRERHWNVGPLKTVRTREGPQHEEVDGVAWNPGVPFLVLRVATPSGEGERFVWVDLAARGVVPRARP